MYDATVSIVVPIYNCAAYLPMCIESIIRQTYPNLDIILIDDGSSDNSLEICKEFAKKDSRIRVLHQENAGVSAARNAGIEMAEGEYITFVDSDDELLEKCISLLVGDIEFWSADFAFASKLYVTSDQQVTSRCIKGAEDISVFTGIDTLVQSLDFDRRMTSCHGKLFRKQFLSDIRFVEGRKVNEDFYFVFLCCLKQPKVVYRNECVYKYYYRENSASHDSFGDKYFDMLYFAEQKKKMIALYYPELLDKATCTEVSTHLFMINMLCKTKSTRYREAEQASIKFVKEHYSNYSTSNTFEKRLAWIVAHGFYPLYKWAVRMKYYR